jgi:hypothetical protein
MAFDRDYSFGSESARVPENRLERLDAGWWEHQIASAVSVSDPILCNLQITLAHYQLSRALHKVTGANAGANFHTWAVWGSKKVGETIRGEDTRRLRRTIGLIGGGCGLGLLTASAMGSRGRALTSGIVLGCLVGIGPIVLLRRSLKRTRREILSGNRTVLEDIGNVTARFVAEFHNRPGPDMNELEQFLQSLRPGPTEWGGQALLSRAFFYYYQARYEQDIDKKHEQMFLANCYAILHEHIRLEPHIRAAMPAPLRRLITARLLRFYLGGESLSLHNDVPTQEHQIFPETLRQLDNPELIAFLQGMGGWDRTPHDLGSSRATNWADLSDRMNFIVDLFRSRHLSPNIFAPPFTEKQEAELMAGQMPQSKL